MLGEEVIEKQEGMVEDEMPSYIHSYLCAEIIEQLLQNKAIRPFPELTLAVGNGLTPDISVYPRNETGLSVRHSQVSRNADFSD